MRSTKRYMRYGKCNIRDIWIYLIGSLLCSLFLIGNIIILKQYIVSIIGFIILFLLYALYFQKYFECFRFEKHQIVTINERIDIPNDVYLLFSATQIQITDGGGKQMLKHKLSVSIVSSSDIFNDLKMLHNKCRYLYTNLSIANIFKSRYIYSFVYNPEIIKHIICLCNTTVVVLPQALRNSVDLDGIPVSVIIDENY